MTDSNEARELLAKHSKVFKMGLTSPTYYGGWTSATNDEALAAISEVMKERDALHAQQQSHYDRCAEMTDAANSQRNAALTASQEQQAEIERLTKERDEARAAHEDRGFDCERMRQERDAALSVAEMNATSGAFYAKAVESLTAERDRYKAALDEAASIIASFNVKGGNVIGGTADTISVTIPIEVFKRASEFSRQALSPVHGGE